jgi:hypothetical protein
MQRLVLLVFAIPFTLTACGPSSESCSSGTECDGECCTGTCDSNGNCYWPPPANLANGTSCESDGECASAYCNNGSCTQAPPVSPTCVLDMWGCNQASDCCSNYCGGGACSEPPTCLAVGASCTYGSACCGNLGCANGVCSKSCGAVGAACSASDDCCSELACNSGTCEGAMGVECYPYGYGCFRAYQCCTGKCDATNHCQM